MFSLFFFVFEGKFQVQAPQGRAYIRRGDLMEGFLRCDFGGLIFGGTYTRRGLFLEFYGMYNFTHAQFRWKTIYYMKKVPYEVHASIACVAGVERGNLGTH